MRSPTAVLTASPSAEKVALLRATSVAPRLVGICARLVSMVLLPDSSLGLGLGLEASRDAHGVALP